MPDLDEQGATAWLRSWQPAPAPDWPPAIRPIEQAPGVAERLASLGALLDEAAAADPAALCGRLADTSTTDRLRTVIAQLGAARMLRLLHWLPEAGLPESEGVLRALLHDAGPEGAAMRRAVEAFRRRVVLHRVFAPERLATLEAAAETLQQETP